jgi:UDP-glucose 4-epimerase
VEALVRLKNTASSRGQIFNIGSVEEISILDLAKRVRSLLGSKSETKLIPYSEAYTPGFEDMPRRKPCIDKLHRVTGFRPEIPLDETILAVAQALRASP